MTNFEKIKEQYGTELDLVTLFFEHGGEWLDEEIKWSNGKNLCDACMEDQEGICIFSYNNCPFDKVKGLQKKCLLEQYEGFNFKKFFLENNIGNDVDLERKNMKPVKSLNGSTNIFGFWLWHYDDKNGKPMSSIVHGVEECDNCPRCDENKMIKTFENFFI